MELLDLIDPQSSLMSRLFSDPCFLCDVLFVLCAPEAEKRSVSDEDFGRALRGDALDSATEALLQGIADFFPQRRKEVLTELLTKMRTYQGRVTEAAIARVKSPEMEAEMEKEYQKAVASMNSASNSPASSESTRSSSPG